CLRFPLGGMEKSETRALARRHRLPVAEKPDSQDICFVPRGSYVSVIERLRPGAAEPGEIVHVDGRVMGRHEGVIHFTVGQRRGLGVASPEPLYVVRLEPEARRVVVGPKRALSKERLTVREVNWLPAAPLSAKGREVKVKLRSAHEAVPAKVYALGGGRAEVKLAEPEAAIAPGQACVMYDGDRVLGGGWIERPAAVAA
ncbi:MAG: aminomethyltransferase beta-barrel domain-containing protein, partial [Alphaproteobacteria bacterium]